MKEQITIIKISLEQAKILYELVDQALGATSGSNEFNDLAVPLRKLLRKKIMFYNLKNQCREPEKAKA